MSPPAVDGADVVWVAYDTPVDDEDRADVDYVVERASRLFPYLSSGTLVLISSQLPVGTTRRLEQAYAASGQHGSVSFAYSPENLRLGKAITAFTQPDRVVVGVRSAADQARVSALLEPFTDRIEWMSVESAEMTKHALNAFLATSVTFINEIAVLCEQVGADAQGSGAWAEERSADRAARLSLARRGLCRRHPGPRYRVPDADRRDPPDPDAPDEPRSGRATTRTRAGRGASSRRPWGIWPAA